MLWGPVAPLQTHPAAHRKSIVKTCVSRTERQLHGEVPPVDIPDSVLSHQALVFVVYNLGGQWEPSGTRDLDWRLPPADWPMGMSVGGISLIANYYRRAQLTMDSTIPCLMEQR